MHHPINGSTSSPLTRAGPIVLPSDAFSTSENWSEQSRVWVTNPHVHPDRIEFLRYAPGTTVPEAVRNNPHIAFRVEALEPYIEGQEILIPLFVVGDFLEVAFIRKYGAILECMRYLKDDWFGN